MFQHLPPLNHQLARFQPQSSPYPPFYQNIPGSEHLNNWLSWECMRWQSNLFNFPPMPVSAVKVEESEPIIHLSGQICESQGVKQEERQRQTKEGLDLKIDQEEATIAAQRRAIQLARKGLLNGEEKDQLKRYRQLRVQGYLSKKEKRTFQKKIVYTTRKRVADRRIRFKGKFINESQAKQLLGLIGSEHSFQDLKTMMNQLKNHT